MSKIKKKKYKLSKVQEIFNKYIRKRDSKDGYFECISCGKILPIEKMNAGHYVPVSRSSFLRFHEWNVSGECSYDNGFNEFHLIGYRRNLIEKIGLTAVEWLEKMEQDVKLHQWKQHELTEIAEMYKEEKNE